MATLGACLAAVRQATLAELAEASQASIGEVRLALRRLAERVEVGGMQVLDDGSAVQPTPSAASARASADDRAWRHAGLTPDQAEVLAIVITQGMAHPQPHRGGGSVSPGLAPAG